jgi:16S rRNA (cytidine1402-2'-O)-methyltransferase
MGSPPPGTLYVVGTPIGHLEDITLRALSVLGAVDLIAAEDTRTTGRMLARHGIATPRTSYHEHNETRRTPELLQRLKGGASIALVSNAGTPGISDPGYRLVAAAAEAGLRVVPIPGPSAAAAALSVSGLPTDAFLFLGFLSNRRTCLGRTNRHTIRVAPAHPAVDRGAACGLGGSTGGPGA